MSFDPEELDRMFREEKLIGLTVWKVHKSVDSYSARAAPGEPERKAWQANLQNSDTSWRIHYGDTPSEAILAVMNSRYKGPTKAEEKLVDPLDRPRPKRRHDII